MTIDTMLPADDPFKFRKNLFSSRKDDSNDQIKVLDRKLCKMKHRMI